MRRVQIGKITSDSTLKSIPLTPEMTELIDELIEIMKDSVVQSAYSDAIAHVQPILDDGKKESLGRTERRVFY